MTVLPYPRSRRYEKNRVPSQISEEIVLIGALVSRNSNRECVNATRANVQEIRHHVNLLGIRKAPSPVGCRQRLGGSTRGVPRHFLRRMVTPQIKDMMPTPDTRPAWNPGPKPVRKFPPTEPSKIRLIPRPIPPQPFADSVEWPTSSFEG